MLKAKDKAIFKKLIQKDERVLRIFYNTHKKPLLNFILRKIKDKKDAEEVLQDTFLNFIEALRDFREQSSLKTYLYAIAHNKSVDKLRRKKIKRILFSRFPERVVEGLARVVMDDELTHKSLAAGIEKVLVKLPNDYAQVLRLKYKEGYKVAEIADKVKLSFKATESLLFRARKAFIRIYNIYERQTLSEIKEKT